MYSVDDVALMVEHEGLDYAITHYVKWDKIEDHTLRELWRQADKVLNEILDYLPDDYSL